MTAGEQPSWDFDVAVATGSLIGGDLLAELERTTRLTNLQKKYGWVEWGRW